MKLSTTARLYRWCWTVVILLTAAGMLQAQTVFYVKKSGGSDAGSGTSWATAFQNLNKALYEANQVPNGTAVEIHVAAGVYRPDEAYTGTQTGRQRSFELQRGDGVGKSLELLAGYPADATNGAVRNPVANPVYLDGNIGDTDVHTDNAYHVAVVHQIGNNVDNIHLVIDGFTIRNGYADGDGVTWYDGDFIRDYGSAGLAVIQGFLVAQTDFKLLNCNFVDNVAVKPGDGDKAAGAGIFINAGWIENCTFSNNDASDTYYKRGGLSLAGGHTATGVMVLNCTFSNQTVAATVEGNALLKNCVFTDNVHALFIGQPGKVEGCRFENNTGGWGSAINGNPDHIKSSTFVNNTGERGGAICTSNQLYSDMEISDCRFIGNKVTGLGGAIYFINSSNILLKDCFFDKNEAGEVPGSGKGGAMYLERCDGKFENLVFEGNIADKGAAVYEFKRLGISDAWISNCTFHLNQKGSWGGAYYYETDDNHEINNNALGLRPITNCAFAGNGGQDLVGSEPAYPPSVTYSYIEGGYVGTGNTSNSPEFKNINNAIGPDNVWGTADDGLQLLACSPLVDAGTNTHAPATDIMGNARFNGDGANGAEVDMGAYESQKAQSFPVGVISGTTEICPGTGTNLVVTITNGTGPYGLTYKNNTEETFQPINGYNSADPISVSPASTNSYSVFSIVDAEKCAATNLSGTAIVTVLTVPTFSASPSDMTANTATGTCSATVNYVATATGSNTALHPLTLSYGFSGATTGSGAGTGSGSVFNKGVTQVKLTASNGCSPDAVHTFNVMVNDAENPTVTAPSAVSATTNTGCTATGVSLGTPVTADNCSVASVTNDAPTIFPLGSTTVTWTVTDGAGNTATATQTVTVTDNVPPTITAPSAVSVTTNTGCTATGVSLGTPVTADNCSVASVTNDAPTIFPLGSTTVTWTGTDGSGNTATATQTVTVTDNVPPTITAPSAVSATTNTGCTATGVSLGTPITADNCSVASVTNDAPTIFPLGSTTVTWTVTDGAGNTATATQTVTVTDNVPPTITAPSAVSATTNTGCTATGISLGTPVTADNCSVASVTNDAPTIFPLGSTTVTWTVTDGAGNTATATQTVTVTDNVPPTITAPSAVSATTNTGCTAIGVSLGTPVTADNCSIASVTNDAPTIFPLGSTTVTWTVTDGAGNTATATQTITVTDNVPPTITAPSAVSATTNTGCTATGVSLGTPVTADNCSVASVTNDAPTIFQLGSTTVTWTVTDGSGNTATATQTVTVTDNIKPAKPTLANAVGECSVTVTAPATTDNCAGTITGTTTDPLTYTQQGSYTITWTFDDGNGNTETATQTVVVEAVRLASHMDVKYITLQPGPNKALTSDCELIATITPGTASGTAACSTYVETSVQVFAGKPYVPRHYLIAPQVNGTARVTLYFLQSEFAAYNQHPAVSTYLPSGPSDLAEIGNLRINQFHGPSNNTATGRPETYSGQYELLNPEDADIVWNSARNWWEISFDVSSFSGFFVTAGDDSALPVTLQSFSAQHAENNVVLNWITTSEASAGHFEIERSINAKTWDKIGRVIAKGESSRSESYSFTDQAVNHLLPGIGKVYYRLRIIDLDGTFDYSPIRSLKTEAPAFDVQVYPNPASRYVRFSNIDANRVKSVTIYSLTGQKVITSDGISEEGLWVGTLPSGVYHMHITGSNNEVAIRRIVIGE